MYAKRFSNVQQFTFADGAERSLSGIRRSSATKGDINAQNEGQKISVPELASAFGANPLLGGGPLSEVPLYVVQYDR